MYCAGCDSTQTSLMPFVNDSVRGADGVGVDVDLGMVVLRPSALLLVVKHAHVGARCV
jgi:hypothetical protein